jgi:DNA polymerase I-like protein with 3'-5' exonuclease and polymerase domains
MLKKEKVTSDDLKVKKPRKSKAPKLPQDLRSVFRRAMKVLDIEALKKPWMAQKSFRLINTAEELEAWVDQILEDKSRHHEVYTNKPAVPVVAVDCETNSLDTRVFVHSKQNEQGEAELSYEVNMELAGVCLSADGIEGLYVPLTHEIGQNIGRSDLARILQKLFDVAHLVFYNAKFDREVLRLCLGIKFRGYPFFEDVQVIQYINDPKADLDENKKSFTGDAGGLKSLSKIILGLEQIELDQLAKVKAERLNPETGKKTKAVQHVPFHWIPVTIALWYAAADGICTWLLWEKLNKLANTRKLIHRIDHELVETLTWIERQRFLVDENRHHRTVNWHQEKLNTLNKELHDLGIKYGWKEEVDDDNNLLESTIFNPGSNVQLSKLLYQIRGLQVPKLTAKGNPSIDAEALVDLLKLYPDDEFLTKLETFKAYEALHPENLKYDPRDKSARIYLKQNVVAGGRLSGAGGKFERDGGFGLNPQGLKRVEGNWWVNGNVLEPDSVPIEEITLYDESALHPSCFIEKDQDGKRVKQKAPNIYNNHIGLYQGYAICLVPKCTECADKYGILIHKTRMDANEVVNIRSLFIAPPGWTFFSADYSNIEMRVAANISGEPEFIKEFLQGEGDFHALTASKVFPEFNNPNTSKARRKELRSLAKIINFALLYGGTSFTIFENMKKEGHNYSKQQAEDMVNNYWLGVPKFHEWCRGKQSIAKEKMICTTVTGRVIDFHSAMEAEGLHKPTEAEMDNYWDHRNFIKKAEEAKREGLSEREAQYRAQANILYKNPETGVRNAKDYNRFMGKIQRVSVNIPLQGLAGDFMRIALNRIRIWAAHHEPLVQAVFRLHGSVHDEIDFAVKNEYVPFVLPRTTRLMKLRKYHIQKEWAVPIECDIEYGSSLDVEHHVTGDKDHKPVAWSAISELENYLPEEFDSASVKALLKAIESNDPAKLEKSKEWLKENLHPNAYAISPVIFEKPGDRAWIKKYLIIALQLHEYWVIDTIPDGEDSRLEKFEDFERRCGLSSKDRGMMPETGWMGDLPLGKVKRPVLEVLGEEVPAEAVNIVVGESTITATVEQATPSKEPSEDSLVSLEEELLKDLPLPKKKRAAGVEAPKQLKLIPIKSEYPVLVPTLTEDQAKKLRDALGVGTNSIKVMYQGSILLIEKVRMDQIPEEYLQTI